MLELIDLRKTHGRTLALDGVSLRVGAGEIVGLLGPNGAGKSTLVSITAGLLPADHGEVRLDLPGGRGGSPRDPAVRRQIGLAPQALALYDELSGAENLRFFAGLHGCAGQQLRVRVDAALEFVGLSERREDRVKTYSGGMARRLNLAAALVHDPALLLLDEPTVGVDPQSRAHLLDNIEQLRAQGKAVLYTTHYMEEAQRICDRVAIIDHGQLLAVDRLDSLLASHAGKPQLVVEFPDGRETVETDDPLASLNALAKDRAPLGFRVERPTLEQVFLQLTGRSLRE
ncbi:ABC transporter, ATP-binding protein [Enhygromyxa salina]|uniref:ABC transporter, ATP-binding protein n=1 Tax=Enhygromyxa salina TaxID=215803 RepID=A0A0C2CWV7_9BACT|nr:ABC transporter ATP-binding protein [Enhygromyxa salina]KIG12332.1 ABC transporter, ATP-binding protein [Enhygromyxa salina]